MFVLVKDVAGPKLSKRAKKYVNKKQAMSKHKKNSQKNIKQ